MFTYQNVKSLILSAKDCETLDEFLAEEGGAIPSDVPYEDYSFMDLLKALYAMRSGVTFSFIREMSGMSKAEFSRHYSIPIRTIENWESDNANTRTAPEYVYILLMCDILNSRYEQ